MRSNRSGWISVAVSVSLVLFVVALFAVATLALAAQTPAAKPPVAKAPAAKASAAKTPAAKGPAKEAPKLVGAWDAVAATPQGELPVVVTIKLVEGQPKCEIEVAGAKQVVSDEKLAGDVLSMKVSYEFGVYDVTAKANGNALEGTWQGGGYSGALKGTRRP